MVDLAEASLDRSNFLNSILPVVIIYEQSPAQVVRRVRSVFPHTIFVYDNSKMRGEPDDCNVIYMHDGKNRGVSAGYNAAFAEAVKLRKKWLLLLDQDTQLTRDYLAEVFEATRTRTETRVFTPVLMDKNGPVSPFLWRPPAGKRINATTGRYDLKRFRFANSGVVINGETFQRASGYDERLLLDFSDIDFGDRLQTTTDHFFTVDVKLEHSFSSSENRSVDETLARFHQFLEGADVMGRKSGMYRRYRLFAFMRAIRFCWIYRSPLFMTAFFKRPL